MSYQTIDQTTMCAFMRHAIEQAVEDCYRAAVEFQDDVGIYKDATIPVLWFGGADHETFKAVRAFVEGFNNSTRKLVMIDDSESNYPFMRQEYHLVVHNTIIAQIDIVRNTTDPLFNSPLLQPKTCEVLPEIVTHEFMYNIGFNANSTNNPNRNTISEYIEKGWKIYLTSDDYSIDKRICHYHPGAFTSTGELNEFCENYCKSIAEKVAKIRAEPVVAAQSSDVAPEPVVATQALVPTSDDMTQLKELVIQVQNLTKLYEKQWKKEMETRKRLRKAKLTMNKLLLKTFGTKNSQ